MTPNRFFTRRIAMDAFEALIESRITSPHDLYDLDGETVLRSRDGRIETGHTDLIDGGM